MNAPQQPNRPQFTQTFPQQFQAMPQPAQPIPTTLMRLVAIIRAISMPTIATGVALIAFDTLMPHPIKPSDLIGGLYGRIVAAESNAAQDTQAAAVRKTTENQTLPPVIAGRLNDSLQTQSSIANLADFACIAGQFVPSNTDNESVNAIGQAMRTQGCAMGPALRQNMTQTLRDGTMLQPQPNILPVQP